MSIKVKVRVVGVFLGNGGAIDVTVSQNTPSPAEVLTALTYKAYRGEIPNCLGFTYIPFEPNRGTNQDLSTCVAKYAEPFRSLSTGTVYPAGVYSLTDKIGGNGQDLVWQYYLFDENNKRLLKPGFSTPFSEVSADPSMQIKDGYTIVFRCVVITTAPNASARFLGRDAIGNGTPAVKCGILLIR